MRLPKWRKVTGEVAGVEGAERSGDPSPEGTWGRFITQNKKTS